MHLLVTQTCDTEIVHHALMSNTPTCDIVFMMYKWHDGGRSVYQCPVSSTPVIMRTLLPFLILTGIWSSSLLPPDLSLVTIFSILSRVCSERQDSRGQQTDQTVHGVEAHEATDGLQTHGVTRGRLQAHPTLPTLRQTHGPYTYWAVRDWRGQRRQHRRRVLCWGHHGHWHLHLVTGTKWLREVEMIQRVDI